MNNPRSTRAHDVDNADGPDRSPTYSAIVLVVALTFLLRLSIAGRNSYWLDELYSVYLYVLQPDTLFGALRDLADTSIHPPLYQATLYVWIALFGDSEAVTRTLSNLYVTAGVVFVYLTALRLYGRRVAFASGLVVSLAFGTMLFGLETRSYGQTLMLSAAAWWGFVLWLQQGERSRFSVPWPALLFFGANLGLLLTHYYNFFLGASQIAFAGFYLLVMRPRQQGPGFIRVVLMYAAQLAAFLLIWGQITYRSLRGRRSSYVVDVPEVSPLRILNALVDHVFWLRFLPTTLILVVGLALIGRRLARTAWVNRSRRQVELLGTGYLVAICLGAPAIAYLSFLAISAERFNARYYLYLVPLIAVAGVVAAREAVLLVLERLGSRRDAIARHLRRFAVHYSLVLASIAVVPGTLDAVAREKDDWRGGAEAIVGIIAADPDNSYAILETSWRSAPMLNYYLDRKGGPPVDGVILRSEERNEEFAFEEDPDLLDGPDRLIVPFIHHATVDFPTAVERLDARFERHHAHLINSRGYIIYDLPD